MYPGNNKSTPTNKIRLYIAFLFFLSLIQYIQTINNDFVWDAKMVLQDPTVREVKYLPSYFTEEFFKVSDPGNNNFQNLKYYRPLVKIINLIEYNVFGTDPTGYNALNILLNALVVVLCFLVVLEITNNPEIAFISSILYAVNPSRVEVVSWAYSLAHLMTAFFSLSSFYFYLKRKYIISVFIFSLSLLSHESAVLLPLVLIAYEYSIRSSKSLRDYSKILPFFILIGIYLIIRNLAVGPPPINHADLFTFINTVAVIIKRYIKIFIIPDAAATTYKHELFSSINTEAIISYCVILFVVFLGIFLWIKQRKHLFWLFWFFAWIAIYFPVGAFGEYLMDEKGLFISSIGLCVLTALFIGELPVKRIIVFFIVAVLATAHSGITFSRNSYWKDTATHLKKVIEFSPGFTLGHYALGLEYSKNGLHDMAIEEFRKAVLLRPELAKLHLSLGKEYIIKKDYKKALFVFRETTQLHPKNSEAYNNMGNTLYILGDLGNAVPAWEKAIELDPRNAEAYYNIGMVMEKRNDFNSALIYYKKYLSIATNPAPAAFSRIQQIESKQSKSTE